MARRAERQRIIQVIRQRLERSIEAVQGLSSATKLEVLRNEIRMLDQQYTFVSSSLVHLLEKAVLLDNSEEIRHYIQKIAENIDYRMHAPPVDLRGGGGLNEAALAEIDADVALAEFERFRQEAAAERHQQEEALKYREQAVALPVEVLALGQSAESIGEVESTARPLIDGALEPLAEDPDIEQLRCLGELALVTAQLEVLRRRQDSMVANARQYDTPWTQIARAVGTTSQAAWRKWDPEAKQKHATYRRLRRQRGEED